MKFKIKVKESSSNRINFINCDFGESIDNFGWMKYSLIDFSEFCRIYEIEISSLKFLTEEEKNHKTKVWQSKDFVKIIGVIYSLFDNGFILKEYKENENIFSRIMFYDERTIFINNKIDFDYEHGEVIEILIRKESNIIPQSKDGGFYP